MHAGDTIGEIALAIEMSADAVDIGKAAMQKSRETLVTTVFNGHGIDRRRLRDG